MGAIKCESALSVFQKGATRGTLLNSPFGYYSVRKFAQDHYLVMFDYLMHLLSLSFVSSLSCLMCKYITNIEKATYLCLCITHISRKACFPGLSCIARVKIFCSCWSDLLVRSHLIVIHGKSRHCREFSLGQ